MKNNILTVLIFVICASNLSAQDEYKKATEYYNKGVNYFEKNKYELADTFFTRSLNIYYEANRYFNRALVRKKLGNEPGYCSDLYLATANGNTEARNLFITDCTKSDTVYLDLNDRIVEKSLSAKTKIIAQRKYESTIDIILIDSNGKVDWSYQGGVDSLTANDTSKVVVELMPSFPGGTEGLVKFIKSNLVYPESARQIGITGNVYVTFVITKDGTVKDAKILRSIGTEFDQEALRVINVMPQWFPGMQRGRFVNVQFNLPIRFSLH